MCYFKCLKLYPEGAESFVLLLYFLALGFRVQTPKWNCYANKNLAWCLLLRYSDGDEGLLAYCYTMIYFSILLLLTNILYYFIFKIQNKVPTCNEGRENVDSNRSRATRVRPDSSTMVCISYKSTAHVYIPYKGICMFLKLIWWFVTCCLKSHGKIKEIPGYVL